MAEASAARLLALDPNTGRNTNNIALNITDPIPGAWGSTTVHNFAITQAGDRLVATGNFRQVNSQSRTKLFVANLDSTGRATLSGWYYPGFAKPCSTTQPNRIAQMHGVDWSPNGSYFVVTGTGQIPRRGGGLAHRRRQQPAEHHRVRRCGPVRHERRHDAALDQLHRRRHRLGSRRDRAGRVRPRPLPVVRQP